MDLYLTPESARFIFKLRDVFQVTAEELVQLVADHLEEHKHLHGGLHFLDEMPHTDTGKIARRKLREVAANLVLDRIPVEYLCFDKGTRI